MLVRNGRTIFQNPGRFSGILANQTGNYIKGGFRNRMVGGLNETFGGYANGHLSPSSFVLPSKSGAISSYVESHISVTANTVYIVIGRPMAGSSIITVTSTPPQLDAIIPMTATGAVILSVDNANLSAAVNASASGSITISGTAELGGIFSLMASGAIAVNSSAGLSALAWIEASAGGPAPLSPEGLANAVWSAPAANNNSTGSMGEKLNDAGSAGNPWSALLVDNQNSGSFGAFVQKLLTTAKFLGFKFL